MKAGAGADRPSLVQVRISLKTLLQPPRQTSLPLGFAAVSVVLDDKNHSLLTELLILELKSMWPSVFSETLFVWEFKGTLENNIKLQLVSEERAVFKLAVKFEK